MQFWFNQIPYDHPKLHGGKASINATSWCWFRREDGEYQYDEGIHQPTVERVLPKLAQRSPDSLITLDIEEWGMWGTATFDESATGLNHISHAFDLAHETLDQLNLRFRHQLGIYRILPASHWKESEPLEAWRYRNNIIYEMLGDRVDCLCPSIYFNRLINDTVESWEKRFIKHIEECDRLDGDKPVRPFINLHVAPVASDSELIDYDTFAHMLTTCWDCGTEPIVWDTGHKSWTGKASQKALADLTEALG